MTDDGVVLEMTDPGRLVPARVHAGLTLTRIEPAEAGRFGVLYRRIWAPLGGGGRSAWSDQDWRRELEPIETEAWVGTVAGDDVAMAQSGWAGDGQAGFVVVGVVPERQGEGIGGDLVTRLTRRLWADAGPERPPTRRVWLWTRPDEHPATIPSYLARGFARGPDLPG